MKVTSKLVASIVLCAGFVHIASAKSGDVSIKMVKEDPKMVFEYVIDTGTGSSDFKKFKRQEKTITFNGNSSINRLYVKQPNDTVMQAKTLTLDGTKPKGSIIFISAHGVPRYWTQDSFNTFKRSKL